MSQTPILEKSLPTPLTRWRWLIFIALGLLALGLMWHFFLKPATPKEQFNPWDGAVSVRTVSARPQDLKVEFKAIGTVTPLNSVVVRSQVSGILENIWFKEGQTVQKGQLLAHIEPAAFAVKLAQAQGEQLQNLAQLKNAEAQLSRYALLFKQDSIARQQVEQQQALVNQLRGSIKADQAKVDDAALQLSYTQIRAPISGRLGLRRIDAGNLIGANDANGLISITQTQPIAVQFSVPENQVMAVRQALRNNKQLNVQLWDRAEQQQLALGILDTLDNQIDSNTGTLKLKAVFNNQDDELFPNQFVNVRLLVSNIPNAISIPVDAVQNGAKGTYVYGVEQGKATIKMLKLGVISNGQVQVLAGLKAGDSVVLEGLDRLREGREVRIINNEPTALTITRSSSIVQSAP